MTSRGSQPRRVGALTAALAGAIATAVISSQAVVPSAAAGLTAVQTPGMAATSVLLPDSSILTAKLAAVSTSGISKVGIVVTTTDGQLVSARSADQALTPASTMKVLTTMAALDVLGPDRTFATTVVDDGGRIVLVGGGDPLLTDATSSSAYKLASLQRLAAATASALKASGRTTISLSYDASLFSGPIWSSHWKSKWRATEARIAALEINSGKVGWRAATNPARTAAAAFAKRLKAKGITVTLTGSVKTSADAVEIARVTSAKVSTILRRTLKVSDNVAAETLSRHAAIATGQVPSFAGAAAGVQAWLTGRGLWTTNLKILDGSGLAPGSRLTPTVLAAAIRLALDDTEFAPVIAGLPVAGESGTLKYRFDDPSERAGRHVVHAKTGTLSKIAGLAGYLTTKDGTTLVFAELANQATSFYRAYDWLDRQAAVIAGCGCRA